jgi:hypothetical protein
VTTFGNDGGAFGLGIEPFNYVAPLGQAGVGGVPANTTPYQVPLYDANDNGGGMDPNQFIPFGGLPAFNPAGNAANPANAISEGLDVFEVAPVVGTYSLSVAVPANTGTVTASTTAAITTVVTLPAFVAPVPVVSVAGGVTMPVVLPAGVTEAYIQLVNYGSTTITSAGPPPVQATSCDGATTTAPVYNTIVVRASGAVTFPAGTVCTAAQNTTANGAPSDGDAFTVQGIGFDYGAYEASYPSSLGNPTPSLVGADAAHQADVTISSQGVYNQPAAGGLINGGGGAVIPAAHSRANGR